MIKLTSIALALGLALSVAVHAKTLSQAVAEVKRQTSGQILSASTKVRGGKRVHVIKVLTPDGRVRTFTIKAD